jgi:hypothetical protein
MILVGRKAGICGGMKTFKTLARIEQISFDFLKDAACGGGVPTNTYMHTHTQVAILYCIALFV